jgi:hypothetical protein
MPDDISTTEKKRQEQLNQSRKDEGEGGETQEKEKQKAKTRFINSGEAIILLAFTGGVEIVQWALDLIPFVGWVVNIIISGLVFLILFIWLMGKIGQGAPKKWLKALWYGAAGGVIPIVPGFLGAIIYLLMQDWKIFGKVFGKLGEKAAAKI